MYTESKRAMWLYTPTACTFRVCFHFHRLTFLTICFTLSSSCLIALSSPTGFPETQTAQVTICFTLSSSCLITLSPPPPAPMVSLQDKEHKSLSVSLCPHLFDYLITSTGFPARQRAGQSLSTVSFSASGTPLHAVTIVPKVQRKILA